jgi:hypothetical protein
MLRVVFKREKERKEADVDSSSTISFLSLRAAELFSLQPGSIKLLGLVAGKLPDGNTALSTLKKVVTHASDATNRPYASGQKSNLALSSVLCRCSRRSPGRHPHAWK